MEIESRKDVKLHIKIDDIVLSLLNDYHNITPLEAIAFFSNLAKQSSEVEGNIVNKNKRMVKGYNRRYQKETYKTVKIVQTSAPLFPWDAEPTYDAYSLRGFYPETKIPFKLSGVKQDSFACFVVALGNKNKVTKINMKEINSINEVVTEAILLDGKLEDISDDFYKVKNFKLQRPKGLPLLKKVKNDKKKENTKV